MGALKGIDLDAARTLDRELLLPLPATGPADALAASIFIRDLARRFEKMAGETPGIPAPVVLRTANLVGGMLFALQAGSNERCLRFAAFPCLHERRPWLRLHADLDAPAVRTRVWTGRASIAASASGLGAVLTGLFVPGLFLIGVGLVSAFATRLSTGGIFEHDRWLADPALGKAAAALLSRLATEHAGKFVRGADLG